MKIIENQRNIDIKDQFDVIVCGAGPAGIAAAINSARNGAKTCLLEVHGCLGGVWTASSLSYILDGHEKEGIIPEILNELDKYNARNGYVCDPESLKYVLEYMCKDAGVFYRYHTRVVSTVKNDNKDLTHVITESKSGREAWKGKIFIDTTGDGDLGFLAGCNYEIGKEGTGETQPMSMLGLLTGPNPELVGEYTTIKKQSRINLKKEILKGGHLTSQIFPALYHIRDDLYLMSANHQYEVSALNADDITLATSEARKEIYNIVRALRSLGGVWRNLKLVSTPNYIGVREGRRLVGHYKVSIDDILNGKKHENSICTVHYKIDVHALKKQEDKQFEPETSEYYDKSLPYDIPLRALIAKDVNNLLMAGRCISGDFLSHSSYRVTGNAATMGQAAGILAAISSSHNIAPINVSWEYFNKVYSGLFTGKTFKEEENFFTN